LIYRTHDDGIPHNKAGKNDWEDGSIQIRDVDFLDDLWRGMMTTFAPSSLGVDPVS
jgi:hypothetical protein